MRAVIVDDGQTPVLGDVPTPEPARHQPRNFAQGDWLFPRYVSLLADANHQ